MKRATVVEMIELKYRNDFECNKRQTARYFGVSDTQLTRMLKQGHSIHPAVLDKLGLRVRETEYEQVHEMNSENTLALASRVLDQGLYFGKGRVTHAIDSEILTFARKIEIDATAKAAEWIKNNHHNYANVQSLCDALIADVGVIKP